MITKSMHNRDSTVKSRLKEAMKELQMMREMTSDSREKTELLSLLSREKEQQEFRNSRTAALLQSKDATIEDLSERYEQALGDIESLKHELEASRQTEKKHGNELIEVQTALEEMQNNLEEKDRQIDEIRSNHRQELEDMTKTMEKLEEEKRLLEGEMDTAAEALDAAEEIMYDLETSYKNDIARMEGTISRLRRFIGDTLNIPDDVVRHLPSLEDHQNGEDTAKNGSDIGLLKANRALEKALIEHAIHTKRIPLPAGSHKEQIAIPSCLNDEAALEEESIDSLKKEVEHLRHAHDIAHQVALHAEGQLMAALDREHDLKEAIKEMQEQKSSAEDKEEQQWREDAMNKILDLQDECKELQRLLSKSEDEMSRLRKTLAESEGEKSRFLAEVKSQSKTFKAHILAMHEETQRLRSKVYELERKLSSREARIAALETTHKFMIDMERSGPSKLADCDPSSRPVEYLVLALKEAAEIQTDLLSNLGELSYVCEHNDEVIEMMENDMKKLKIALSEDENNSDPDATFQNLVPSIRSKDPKFTEFEALRSKMERSLAIQIGQAEAYSGLAATMRERDAELHLALDQAMHSLQENNEFVGQISTAVSALKSGLASILLAHNNEDEAQVLLSRDSNPFDIIELSVVVSEKLKVYDLIFEKIDYYITQGIFLFIFTSVHLLYLIQEHARLLATSTSEDFKRQEADSNAFKELQENYTALLSAYESAKSECRHAKSALDFMKRSYQVSSVATPPAQTPEVRSQDHVFTTTQDTNASRNSRILHFIDQFEQILDETAHQQEKIKLLEEQLACASNNAWSKLVGKYMLRQKTVEVWKECKTEIETLESQNAFLQTQVNALEGQLADLEGVLEVNNKQTEISRERHDQELRRIKEIYESQISTLKHISESERSSLRLDVDVAMEKAAEETRQMCWMETRSELQGLQEEVGRLQSKCRQLEDRNKLLIENFEKYKTLKDAEKSLLQGRLGLKEKQPQKSGQQGMDPIDVIGQACRDDAVQAAIQEAKLERLARAKLESEFKKLSSLNKTYPQNSCGATSGSMLEAALSEARQKIDKLTRQLENAEENSLDSTQLEAWQDEASRLQTDIVNLTLALPTTIQ